MQQTEIILIKFTQCSEWRSFMKNNQKRNKKKLSKEISLKKHDNFLAFYYVQSIYKISLLLFAEKNSCKYCTGQQCFTAPFIQTQYNARNDGKVSVKSKFMRTQIFLFHKETNKWQLKSQFKECQVQNEHEKPTHNPVYTGLCIKQNGKCVVTM